ncbi:hypothetical protein [Pararhizobium gei]|uniref:hypothetical protein n=1 Tax=Pararhizobium gei TaxID=1395951 RepID=UPI0023DCC340|nr:hypothetical protein [Rhizobium gei]
MERMFSAALTSPAKIDDETKGVGASVVVSEGILLQLLDGGNVDRLSVTMVFDPDADPDEDAAVFNAALIETAVSARAAIIQADAEERVKLIQTEADLRISIAENDASDRIALIEAAATARIEKAEEEAAVKIAAAVAPPDPDKPAVKSKPK